MKKTKQWMAAALAVAGALITAHAQPDPWELVFDQVFSPTDLAEHPDGSVYAAGYCYDFATQESTPTVIRGTERGTQWETVFATLSLSPGDEFRAMTIVPSGTVYVCGQIGGVNGVWSGESGLPWKRFELDGDFRVQDIASDAAGNIYVCGTQDRVDDRIPARWQTLKGTPTTAGGVEWLVLDTYGEFSKNGSYAGRIAVRPSSDPDLAAEIWVAGRPGYKTDGRGSITRALRKSVDGGASWTTVGAYDYANGGGGIMNVAVNAAGTVVTAGRGYRQLTRTTGEYYWLTRLSTDGGDNWQDVDALGGYAAYAVAFDPEGNLFVAGQKMFDGGGGLVRRSADGGQTWQTSLEYAWGEYGLSLSAVSDLSGDVFVGGLGQTRGVGLIYRLAPSE